MKKPSKEYLRNKADRLLQDYIKKRYIYCLVCSEPVNCGHHFVRKKNSNALRYYLPNIIPLCQQHHLLCHTQPFLVEPRICYLKGQEWYDDLERERRTFVKANAVWYAEKIEELEKVLNYTPSPH